LLDRAKELGAPEDGLVVVATIRTDGSAQASVVNAGVLDHPVTGESVVGFVARGRVRKLAILRARPRATVVFRSGWEWVTVEGDVELAGPDDRLEGLDHSPSWRPPSLAPPQSVRRPALGSAFALNTLSLCLGTAADRSRSAKPFPSNYSYSSSKDGRTGDPGSG